MSDQTERLENAYETLKESDEYDHQRVAYEHPQSEISWEDGWVAQTEMSGESALSVVKEDETVTIPMARVVSVRTIEP